MKIKTYDELREFVKAFGRGELNLLIIKSVGGTGKSQLLKEYAPSSITFKGHSTPLSIFMKLIDNSNKNIIFDDVDLLLKNKGNISLLKQLTETTPTKVVQYNSTSQVLEDKAQSFVSTNKVCLLVNDIRRVSANMKAMLTRGFYIEFIPSPQEVYAQLLKFAKDEEILKFLKDNINNIKDFNLRIYTRCVELKNAGLNYRKWVKTEFCKDQETMLIEEIKDLPIKERNQRWEDATNKSIRTLQKRLKQ